MQIIINQKEIEKAIKLYLSNTVMVRNLSEVTIDLIATRSGEGVKATIDFCNEEKEVNPSDLVQEEIKEESQEENPEGEPEKEPEKEEPHPRRTSLFAGMTKPVNKES